MEQRVCQGIVDDAAAICGALVAELRIRKDLLGLDATPELGQAAVGGALASPRVRRDDTGRRLQDMVGKGLLADGPGIERNVHLVRCPPEVAQALELGRLAPPELWCADVPLTVENESAGILRLLLDRAPRRSLLRALRGVGHEASLQLAQERGRLQALADLGRARQNLTALAAAAARMRRETERSDVLAAIAEELRKLGFESALLLSEPEGLVLAHMSHKRQVIDEAMKLVGVRRFSELRQHAVDPERQPLLGTLLQSPEPVTEMRPHALLRALWGRRAPRPVRMKLIELLGLREMVAAPLRGASDTALGILIAAPQGGMAPDLGVLSSFALQAALALERVVMRERMRVQAQLVEEAVEDRTRFLREANERLKEADRRKDNFLANVSHELRSPLVTMLGYTDLLLAEKMGAVNDRQRQCLQVARGSGKRLRAFIEELLDFSRFELTAEQMTFQPFDMGEAVQQAMADLAPRFLERRLNLRQRIRRGGAPVLGDRERILQVLSNLLTNAERHCRDGGKIVVSAEQRTGFMLVSVQDNGTGIPASHVSKIFDRLYQVGDVKDARSRQEGLGLGLNLVAAIVKLHDFRFTIRTGSGCVVEIGCPSAPAAA